METEMRNITELLNVLFGVWELFVFLGYANEIGVFIIYE